MTTSNCGYQGHVCSAKVQFISRYKDHNDYCVRGKRIRLMDGGTLSSTCHEVTEAERQAIQLYLLDAYADYCKWHSEAVEWLVLAPFDYTFPLRIAATE